MLRGVTVLPPSINDDESLHSSCTGQRRKGQRARGKGQSGKDTREDRSCGGLLLSTVKSMGYCNVI